MTSCRCTHPMALAAAVLATAVLGGALMAADALKLPQAWDLSPPFVSPAHAAKWYPLDAVAMTTALDPIPYHPSPVSTLPFAPAVVSSQ